MKKTDLYDVADPIDIERYAKELIGKNFQTSIRRKLY